MRWSDYFWGFHLAARRFTDNAVYVLAEARYQTAVRHHRHIEPAHVLLGLATVRKRTTAILALGRLGVDLQRDLDRLAALIGGVANAPEGRPTFSPESKQLLADARQLARDLQHDYIGTEHLALSLLRSESFPVAEYFQERGITGERFLEELIGLLNHC